MEDIKVDYQSIKAIAGIFDTYRDDQLNPMIDAVVAYAYNAGVSREVLESKQAEGLLAVGLADLDNPGASGDLRFSPVFELMLAQMSYGR